jgi:hypothetical protein
MMLENESFKRFLEEKSTNVKVERRGETISWEESVESGKNSFTGFLEFAYSKKTSGEYIYLDRSTAFDILDRINWMDGKIRSMQKRLKILTLLLLITFLFAAWGWLT